MSKLKTMVVFGTRPEAIKMAPLIAKLRNEADFFMPVVVVTGQHRQMLDQVLKLFGITPDYDLHMMTENQTLDDIVVQSIKGLGGIIRDESPDIVLVQGDTTSAFASALAAFHNKVCIGHVEAGLRTHNKYNPFPEEMNRHLIGVLADFHFVPTERSRQHLLNENVPDERIHVTGNTVIDALMMTVKADYSFSDDYLKKINFTGKRIITLTTHRRESFGEAMANTFAALKTIVSNNKDVEVVFPVHHNPNVRNLVSECIYGYERIHLIDPLDYESFVHLMNASYLILTDSGGIQEEAPALGKPVLVLRETTERPEAVESGVAKLVGTDPENIVSEVNCLLKSKDSYNSMSCAINPYGDGKASKRIADVLKKELT